MDKQSMRQLIVSSAAYSLSSILGPLLMLGVPAYFLDQYFGTKPMIMLAAVGVSFIISNILLYKKVTKINRMIAEQYPPAPKTPEEDEGNPSDQVKLWV